MKQNSERRLYQVDAFTREAFLGNPAGILLDAEGLSDSQMQAIARELNNSESAFVLPADGADHDIRVRFFTPTTEIPMCGHNTIALHYVRAVEGEAKPGVYRQKTKAGIIPVTISPSHEGFRITMSQPAPKIDPPLVEGVASELQAALGIGAKDVLSGLPIQIVSTGNRKVIVPMRELSALHGLNPKMERLAEIGKRIDCTGFYCFFFDPNALSDLSNLPLTHGRMFGPQIGIAEDPVTGMGIGPVAAYLVENGLIKTTQSSFRFKARQGEAMGRMGEAAVLISLAAGKTTGIEISGEAAIVFKTSLTV